MHSSLAGSANCAVTCCLPQRCFSIAGCPRDCTCSYKAFLCACRQAIREALLETTGGSDELSASHLDSLSLIGAAAEVRCHYVTHLDCRYPASQRKLLKAFLTNLQEQEDVEMANGSRGSPSLPLSTADSASVLSPRLSESRTNAGRRPGATLSQDL